MKRTMLQVRMDCLRKRMYRLCVKGKLARQPFVEDSGSKIYTVFREAIYRQELSSNPTWYEGRVKKMIKEGVS